MIDAILYGKDDWGRLTLQERRFASLRALSSYFSSPKAVRWEWVEVEISADPCRSRAVHFTADALRALVVSSSLEPGVN